MDYKAFIRLRNSEQAYHTLSHGTYRGTNEAGDDIYQLYDFWVSVHENTKGFYYDAQRHKPDYVYSGFFGAQEL